MKRTPSSKADKTGSVLSTRGAPTINQLVLQELLSRRALLSKWMDPRRDIDAECGHPDVVTIEDYQDMLSRNDVAGRVVSVYPEETWSEDPQVFENEDENETEFEKAWEVLKDKMNVFTHLQRADVLSGVGRFGILLLGLSDGKELKEAVDGIDAAGVPTGTLEHELIYLRPLDESVVKVATLEGNVSNPRCGLPTSYDVQFSDASASNTQTSQTKKVHWSRVIHLADNRTNSEVYGTPRMQRVFDRLLDLKKIAGGSGEMFWKGGFPGLSLQTHPGDGEVELDKDATKAEMEAYMNGLQRYIATIGMDVKTLGSQIADPRPHVEIQLKLMAIALAVPWRVFVGSEAAQLASEQDMRNWNRRLNRRRKEYVNGFIIRPFIDRLIAFGTLPTPVEYEVHWEDLNSPSDLDKASVAERQSSAMSKYVSSGCDLLMSPFHYLTLVLGLADDEARSVIEEAGEGALSEERDAEREASAKAAVVLPPPGGRNGNARQPAPPARR